MSCWLFAGRETLSETPSRTKLHIDLHLKYCKKTQLVVSNDFVYVIPDPEERRRMHDYVVAQMCNLRLVWANRGVAPAHHAYQLRVRLTGQDVQDLALPARNQRCMPSEAKLTFMEDYGLQLPASMTPRTYILGLKLYCPKEARGVRLALSPSLLDEDGYYRVCLTQVQVVAQP